MDGDIINLPEVIRLCRKHDAMLMVDEAHSIGVLGETGHGILEHFDLTKVPKSSHIIPRLSLTAYPIC